MNLGWEAEKSDRNKGKGECIIKGGILVVVFLRVEDKRGCLNAVWKVWVENKRLKMHSGEDNHQSKVLRGKVAHVCQNGFQSGEGCRLCCGKRRERVRGSRKSGGLAGGEFLSGERNILRER